MKKLGLIILALTFIGAAQGRPSPRKTRDKLRLSGYDRVTTLYTYDQSTGTYISVGVICQDVGEQRCRTFSIAELGNMDYNSVEASVIYDLFNQSDIAVEQNSMTGSVSQVLTFQNPDGVLYTNRYIVSWFRDNDEQIIQELKVLKIQ
jgi:hypothetical protein